jgi:hypothetical protein
MSDAGAEVRPLNKFRVTEGDGGVLTLNPIRHPELVSG